MKTLELGSPDRMFRCLRGILLAAALLYVVVYVVVVLLRIQYPFELEWMEGGSVDHVRRILSGQQLYVRPSLEFVPFFYPPLYFYVSAGLSKMIGVGFTALRLVSFASSLGCLAIIYLMVRQEVKSRFAGVLAAGLFAATFRIGGAWLDIARVDSLFLLFLLGAIYMVKCRPSSKSYVLAGALVALSFLTKQIALAISIPIMLYCFIVDRRRSVFFAGTVVLTIGISTLVLDLIHEGWYSYYVFRLATQHSIVQAMFTGFWSLDIAGPLFVAFSMSIFYIVAQFLRSVKRDYLFYSLMVAGMLGGAWLSRLHSGGYDNVLLPAYASIAILFGLGTHMAFNYVDTLPAVKRKVMSVFVCSVCIMQLAALAYNPVDQVPTQEDLEAGWGFVDTMAQFEGEILVPCHGYLPTLAGKNSYAHEMALRDVLRGDTGEIQATLLGEVREAVEDQRFSAIILDTPGWYLSDINLEEYYVRQQLVFDSGAAFWPVTGMSCRPQSVYVPISGLGRTS